MKTAIVYRANPHLDANLLPLKERVDFFIRFEAAEMPQYGIEIDVFVENALRSEMTAVSKEEARIFTDLTCAKGAYRFTYNINILSQWGRPLVEEHVRQIIDEGRPVIVVRENLADHVHIDGIDSCGLDQKDCAPGGWYHAKVLAIWEDMLRARGVQYDVIHISELNMKTIGNSVVVCDHHCSNKHYTLFKSANLRNAFSPLPPGKFTKPEDILSHCL